jgi:hypothetical protein
MGTLELIVLVGIVGAAAWMMAAPRFEFRVRITDGSLQTTKGRVRRDFLDQLGPLCRELNIQRGWIGGVRRHGRVTLVFSREFPDSCRQQIRNLWTNL